VDEVCTEAKLWNFIHDKLQIDEDFVDLFFFFPILNCCPIIIFICLL